MQPKRGRVTPIEPDLAHCAYAGRGSRRRVEARLMGVGGNGMLTTTVGVLRIDRVELREELEQAWWYRCRIAHTVNRNPNTQVHNSRILWEVFA